MRRLSEIAAEIVEDWKFTYFAARPYLGAMLTLDGMEDYYMNDSARSVVTYFLSNARSWKGPTARRIKAELNQMLEKSHGSR